MRCGVCATVNPDGAAFCMSCGNPLTASCANCGADLPAEARFCLRCGHPVAEAAADDDGLRRFVPAELLEKLESAAASGAMQGERRTVTMLFCDIQGSTTAAEHMDPEEWAAVMNGAFEHLIAPVYRYEGTLARLMGDAILAFFGAPIGHEDDPERAVRAGLEILEEMEPYREAVRSEWGVDLDVRVGVNTGLVVVGAVGSDLRLEYTAMGDAVNVAARMEQTADAGTVRIADATRRMVDKLFEFESLGPVEVKGRSEPVEAHRVLAAVARPDDIRGIEGLRAPMVGRDAEFAALADAVTAVAEGQGRIVSVTGEAGLGKSRLVREVRDALTADGLPIDVAVGRSLSFETSVPFASARRLVMDLLGLGPDHPPAEVWETVERVVASTCPGREADVAPFIAWVVGAEAPPEVRARTDYLDAASLRERAFSATLDLIEASARLRPLLLVLEDLHWADSASMDLAVGLLDLAERAPVCVLAVFRPRRHDPSWAFHEAAEREHPHISTHVALRPLDADDARTLVSSLLDVDGLPDAVRASILEKADGNPFFLEEVLRSMIDAGLVSERDGQWVASEGVAEVAIPETLAAVITTRLDRLDDAAKQVAQCASVVGREFRYDELAAVLPNVPGLESALVTLQRRDMVRETARTPRRVFRFKHALVQEAVYDTVLLRRRREMHGSLADYLQEIQPERVEDIADHLLAARRMEQALPLLLEAGRRALRGYALPEAQARFESALEILDGMPDADLGSRRWVLEGLGKVAEGRFDFAAARDLYARLEAAGEEAGDLEVMFSGRNKRAFVTAMMFEERESALEWLAQTEADARATGLEAGLAEACTYQCYIRTAKGEFDKVEEYMEELYRIGEDLEDTQGLLFSMVHLANTLMLETRADDALAQGARALARAEASGHLKFQAEVLSLGIAFAHVLKGEFAEAADAATRGMEIALRIGDRETEVWAGIVLGQLAVARGDLEQGLDFLRRADDAARTTDRATYTTVARCMLGWGYERIGGPMLERALELHAETLAMSSMPVSDYMATWVWSEIGMCALAAGDLDRAERFFRDALEVRSAAMFTYRPVALDGLSRVMLIRGRVEEARTLVDEMREYVMARSLKNQYVPLRMAEARVARAAGDHAAALAALDECRALAAGAGFRRVELDIEADRMAVLRQMGDDGGHARALDSFSLTARDIGGRFHDEELRSAFDTAVDAMLARATAGA